MLPSPELTDYQAFASPAEADYSIRRAEDELLPIEDMSWTGSVFPGSPEVTLHGSAKSIYDQIMELNPHYSAFDFPDLVEEFAAEGITKENFNETFGEPLATRGLERRASVSHLLLLRPCNLVL